MGIQYLHQFMNGRFYANRRLPVTALRDCTVVIDGGNFAYNTYYDMSPEMKAHNAYGGDYDTYAQFLRQRLVQLQECAVLVLVLFDGVRGVNKLEKCRFILEKQQKILGKESLEETGNIEPMFLVQVFREVLRELKIPQLTCDHEADGHIVNIAREVQGFVISDDADFYIFDCPCGFIPLRHIEWRVNSAVNSQKSFLLVRRYNIEQFVTEYNIPGKNYLRLLSPLLGNFYVQPNDTEVFIRSLVEERFLIKAYSPVKIKIILNWLSNLPSQESGIEEIVKIEQNIPSDAAVNEKSNLYLKLKDSVMAYDVPDCITFSRYSCQIQGICSLSSKQNQRLPEYIYQLFQSGCLLNYVMTVICERTCTLSSHVEEMAKPSAHECVAHLRTILYTIAASVDTDGGSNTNIAVTEYNRVQARIVATERKSVPRLPDGSPVPTLLQLEEQSDTFCYAVLLNCLEYQQVSSDDSSWSRFMTVFTAVLRYWQSHTSDTLHLCYVAAVVLSLIKLLVVDSPKHCHELYGDGVPTFSDEEGLSVVERLKGFTGLPQSFVLQKVHNLAEFQAIMRAVYGLNAVLNVPVCIPQMHYIYKGTFIYHLICELENKSKQEIHEYVEDLLVVPALVQLFGHMMDNVAAH